MKIIAALSVCLFMANISQGQTAAAPKKGASDKKVIKVNNITGVIKNSRNKPIKGVEAFVYKADSTIIASGNTDSSGHYTTNGVPEGTYFVKLIYPGRKVTMVYGINVKASSVELNLKADAPEADTMMAYEVVMPKLVIKKDAPKKK
jgi:hypothetical protein